MPIINGTNQPTFNDIREHLRDTDPRLGEKHLRLDDNRGLHLHDTGKPSSITPQALRARHDKHQQAFDQVVESINRQLRRTEGGQTFRIGNGEDVLRDVLSEHSFENRLISVNDLDRIAQRLDEVERAHRDAMIDQIVDSFAGQLGQDPELAQRVRQALKDAPLPSGVKPDVLRGFAKGEGDWLESPPNDLEGLRDDMDRMGPWQALARHGLIRPASLEVRTGTAYQQLTTSDNEGFSYQHITGTSETWRQNGMAYSELLGHCGKVEPQGSFFHYRTHDKDQFVSTGDKVHISIAPDQVEKAWDVIAPILMDNPDVIKHFKVTNLKECRQEITRLDEKIAEQELEKLDGLNEEEIHRIDQRIAELRAQREVPARVYEGAQITIYHYQPKEGEGIAPERFQQVIAQLTEALQKHNFAPGRRPGSDLQVNDFVTYRNDKTDDGGELRPEDPHYGEYLEKMKGRPLYVALSNPGVLGAMRELQQFGQRVGAGEEIRGRRNEDGSVTLYGSGRRPGLGSWLTGSVERRRERAGQELQRLLARIETGLGPNGAGPATQQALQRLRELVDAGPLRGEQLSQATTELAQSLYRDHGETLQRGRDDTARREDEAGRLTRQRIEEVRNGRYGDAMTQLGQEIRDFERSQLRPTQTVEKGVALNKDSFKEDSVNDRMSLLYPTDSLERQWVDGDMTEPDVDVPSRALSGTRAFMEISQQLYDSLSTGSTAGRGQLAKRLGDLLASELQSLGRTEQLKLTVGDCQALIERLVGELDTSWPPHNLGPALLAFAGEAYAHALTQLSDRINDDGTVLVDGKLYALQSKIAQGGFGRVDLYEAEDGSCIVLKTPLRNESRTLDEQRKEARNEVRAHRVAQDDGNGGLHPGIIGFIGAMRGTDGLVRIAMEYAPGGNLQGLIDNIDQAKKNGDISPQAAMLARITLFRDVLQGMRHVQEARGMLHLDLKPVNFFIGGDGTAKVGDFGTGQVTDSLDLTRRLVDNPRWVAPEIVKGLSDGNGVTIEGSSDVWSLGVVAYQLFHEGALPFDHPLFASQVERLLKAFGDNDDNRIRTLGRDQDGQSQGLGVTALDRLLNQLLHPDPESRPSLGQVLQGQLFHEPGVGSDDVRALIQALSTGKRDDVRELSRRIGV